MLTFKDLWDGNLLLGVEKCIGRGVLNGIEATVVINNESFTIDKFDLSKIDQKISQEFNNYISSLYN